MKLQPPRSSTGSRNQEAENHESTAMLPPPAGPELALVAFDVLRYVLLALVELTSDALKVEEFDMLTSSGLEPAGVCSQLVKITLTSAT